MRYLPDIAAALLPAAATAALICACAATPEEPAQPDSAVPARQATAPTAARITRVADPVEIPIEKTSADAPAGHPLTSVVVTQCNLIVAVYVTMPDGRLLRFDHSVGVPLEQLLSMAYSATRSERVEVACEEGSGGETSGAVGYEKHAPV